MVTNVFTEELNKKIIFSEIRNLFLILKCDFLPVSEGPGNSVDKEKGIIDADFSIGT